METLGSLAHLLDHWGGHAHAAGFTLKKDIDPEFFSSALVAQCTHHAASPSLLSIDAHANFEELDDVFSSSLLFFAPFGEGNPTPLLLTRNAIVVQASKVGKSGQHTKCLLMDSEGDERKAIAFGSVLSSNSSLQEGVHVDIVYEPVHNTWNGTTTLELYIRDVRYAE